MLWPSTLADTVTPPIAWPAPDLTAPLSTTSAAAAGDIQAASEIAIAPATPANPCAFLIVPLPVRRDASRRDRACRDIFFELNRLRRDAGRLTPARQAGGACSPFNAGSAP